MGRREAPLDPTAGPLQAFATDLRALRRRAGSPSYQALAGRAYCSKSTLAAAANGEALPALAVTLAYVRACGGNVFDWERRWHELADHQATLCAAVPTGSATAPDGSAPPSGDSGVAGSTAEVQDETVDGGSTPTDGPTAERLRSGRRLNVVIRAAGATAAAALAFLVYVTTAEWIWAAATALVMSAAAWIATARGSEIGPGRALRTSAAAAAERGAGSQWRRSLAPPRGLMPTQVRGRDALVTALRRVAEEPDGQVHVLCGLGGCGKTTIALATAVEMANRGAHVWWINVRGTTSLSVEMADLARDLGATKDEVDRAAAGQGSLTDLVWQHLDAVSERWVLVLDNADHPDLLAADGGDVADGNGVVRGSSRGMVLVTTRVADPATWGDQAAMHPVGTLDTVNGGQVLRDLAPSAGTMAEATALAHRLGGLPLALHAAGRYLESSRARVDRVTTFDAYLLAINEQFGSLLGTASQSVTAHEAVMTTWELSMDWLAAHGLPQARSVMRLLGGFAPTPIPVEILETRALYGSHLFAPHANDPRPWRRRVATAAARIATTVGRADGYNESTHRQVVAALCNLGLLNVHTAGTEAWPVACMTAHPLVTEVNAAWLTDDPALAAAVHHTVATLLSNATRGRNPYHASAYVMWPLLAPHVSYAITRGVASLRRNSFIALGDAAGVTICGLGQAADYVAATRLSATAGDSIASRLPSDHPVALAGRLQAATILLQLNQNAQARAQFTDILPTMRRVLGANHPLTLRTRHNLALSYAHDGRGEQAVADLEDLLQTIDRVLGRDSELAVLTRNNLAETYTKAGWYDKAEAELRAALPAAEAMSAACRDIVFTRNWLATVLMRRGRYEQSEAEFRAARELAKRTLGPEHPYTVRILSGLGELLACRGLFDDARVELSAALAIQERIFGPDHLSVIETRSGIARVLAGQRRYVEAIREYQTVLDACTRVFVVDTDFTREAREAVETLYASVGEDALRTMPTD